MEYGCPGVGIDGEPVEDLVYGAPAMDTHDTATALACEAEHSVEDLGLYCAMLAIAGAAVEPNFADVTGASKKLLE